MEITRPSVFMHALIVGPLITAGCRRHEQARALDVQGGSSQSMRVRHHYKGEEKKIQELGSTVPERPVTTLHSHQSLSSR